MDGVTRYFSIKDPCLSIQASGKNDVKPIIAF